ncbi:flagellar motor switch protein FliN [Novosphingobium sp. 9]|uniref:flagellar motor switch protein FliN n=1 Tax=Novosphingobium sp. 9 TaxID=2025349 RepID=UPI0021B5C244|nr:flagellar motor switch protein FliN [Novosphingobium sp. 9]
MTSPVRTLDFLRDVDVRLSVELGRTEMKLKDVLALGPESLVTLDRMTDDLLDVLVNGKPVARGEIVSQNGRFGLRIVEMIGEGEAGGNDDPDSDAPAMPGVGRF